MTGEGTRAQDRLPTLAALCSAYRPRFHSQHIVDRFLMGYEVDGRLHQPPFRVASMYVDLDMEGDISDARCRDYGVRKVGDIATALTLGSGQLAVDGVLLVCENGDYPTNDKGQILYPRFEFFQQLIEVFEAGGRAVPVFIDKHLSYDWSKTKTMVEQIERLAVPVLAGSSLPVTWRLPDLDLPLGVELDEAVVVYPGPVESYGIHALETMQCMVERRRGGETGVAAVHCLEGEAVWAAARDGRWSMQLLREALARHLPRSIVERRRSWSPAQLEAAYVERGARAHSAVEAAESVVAALLVEYRDGLRGACICLDRHVGDFTFATRRQDGVTLSSLFFLGGPPQSAYHGVQVQHMETLMATGRPDLPLERTVLTTGILAHLMDSRGEGHRRLETPELDIAYPAPPDDGHARGPMPVLCPWCPGGRYEPQAA